MPPFDRFLHRGQPAVQVVCLRHVVVGIFIQLHACGHEGRLYCVDSFVSGPDALVPQSLYRLLLIATGPVVVICMGDRQQDRHLIRYHVQDRIQVLIGGAKCSPRLC